MNEGRMQLTLPQGGGVNKGSLRAGLGAPTRPVGAALARMIGGLLPDSPLEWLWWPFFAFWAFFPSTRAGFVNVGGMYVYLKDITLACLALVSLPWLFLYRNRCRPAFRWTFLPFTALMIYAIATAVVRADYRSYDFPYIISPAIHAWSAMALAFALVCSLPPEKLPAFANRLVVAVSAVAFVYVAILLFPSTWIRAYATVDPTFGMKRLGGPLGGPTVVPAIFVVTLSFVVFSVQQMIKSPFGIIGATVLSAAILFSGSRAAILALLAFLMLTLLRGGRLLRKVVVFSTFAAASAFVFHYASPERFLDLSEVYRTESYWSSLRAWTANVRSLVLGHGFGQIWPYYFYDAGFGGGAGYGKLLSTEFGRVLYHPHSTVLYVLAETGIVGMCLLGAALGRPLLRAYRAKPGSSVAKRLAPGVLATLVIFAFDTMLLKGFELAAVWWTFLFLMAAENPSKSDPSQIRDRGNRLSFLPEVSFGLAKTRARRTTGGAG